MEPRKENVITVVWEERRHTHFGTLSYYSTLPYKKGVLPKIPATEPYVCKTWRTFFLITRLSSFCHRASRNAIILQDILWKWKLHDVSSWPTTQWNWLTRWSWFLLTGSNYWVGDLTSQKNLLCLQTSLVQVLPQELRYPAPELSLIDSGASHRATQNKVSSSSTKYSFIFESSLGSILFLKPFLLILEHLYIPFNHFSDIQSLMGLDWMAHIFALSCLWRFTWPTSHMPQEQISLGKFSSVLYSVWNYSFHLGKCRWIFDELN